MNREVVEVGVRDLIAEQTHLGFLDSFVSPAKALTRREFLKLGGVGVGSLAFKRFVRPIEQFFFHERVARFHQEDIPPNTMLRKTPKNADGFPFPDVSHDVLEAMNGPDTGYGDGLNTAVLWLPSDGGPPVDAAAHAVLWERLVARAALGRNEEKDEGFYQDEGQMIQNTLPGAVKGVTAFFGGRPLFISGIVMVIKPSAENKKRLKEAHPSTDALFGPSGALGGSCSIGTSHGRVEAVGGGLVEGAIVRHCTNDGTDVFSIAMLTGFYDDPYYKALAQERGVDVAWKSYTEATRVLLGHELGHAMSGLNDDSFSWVFDGHKVVDMAGNALSLVPVLNASPEEIRRANWWDQVGLESYTWKAVKRWTGREFYGDLLRLLIHRYPSDVDENLQFRFPQQHVEDTAEELFERYSMPYSFGGLRESIGKEPDRTPRFPFTDAFSYPQEFVERVTRESDGIVSWWVPVPWPSEVDIFDLENKWLWAYEPHQPFPRRESGMWINYRFLKNGPIQQGPPEGNRLAIAVWAPGGRLTEPNENLAKDSWFNITDPRVIRATAEEKK